MTHRYISATYETQIPKKDVVPFKFVADAMLGRLARWLRMMGCDVYYNSSGEDSKLLAIALAESRILLTRDVRLAQRAAKAGYFVKNEGTSAQVAEIIEKFGIEPTLYGDICPVCNGEIIPVAKESVRTDIPRYTYFTHEEFRRCNSCGKIFWEGTHRGLAEKDLGRILGDENK